MERALQKAGDNSEGRNFGDIAVSAAKVKDPASYIPVYDKATELVRTDLNRRMAALDTLNPDSATFFGGESLKKVAAVSQQIYSMMSEEQNGVFRKPVEEIQNLLQSLDMEVLTESVNDLLREGGKVVKHNKGALAVTAGAMLMGQFWVAATTGGWTAMQEFVRRKREITTLRNSPEVIEERLRDAIGRLNGKFREVEQAASHAPRIIERVNAMALVNRDCFNDARHDIAAGREKLRRVLEEEIPALELKAAEEPGFENDDAVEMAKSFAENLNRKLKVLEMALVGSVEGTAALAMSRKAAADNLNELTSIITLEGPVMQRTAVTAGLALDSYRTTRVTESFRDHVAGMQDDTVRITMLAQEAAERGRLDNPERMKKTIERIETLRANVESQRGRALLLDQQSSEQRAKLHDTTMRLLTAMAEASNPAAVQLVDHQEKTRLIGEKSPDMEPR